MQANNFHAMRDSSKRWIVSFAWFAAVVFFDVCFINGTLETRAFSTAFDRDAECS